MTLLETILKTDEQGASNKSETKIGIKIGEGRYREVFQIDDERCIKKLKPSIQKRYGPFTVNYNARLYSLGKFRISDFNSHEFFNYQKLKAQLPQNLQKNFAEIYGVQMDKKGNSSSLSELIRNYNGRISKTLAEHDKINNEMFWENVKEIENFFAGNNIPYFNVHPQNIAVKWLNKSDAIPVFMDFKRIGKQTYPFQFWLIFTPFMEKKRCKQFERIYRNYKG